MKHLGLAAPEQHQHVHQHVHFTPEQLNRMTDEQLDRTEATYTVLVAIEQEVAADDAQRDALQGAGRRQHLRGRRAPARAVSLHVEPPVCEASSRCGPNEGLK